MGSCSAILGKGKETLDSTESAIISVQRSKRDLNENPVDYFGESCTISEFREILGLVLPDASNTFTLSESAP